ncbi:MAG: putative lipid II flippase FtsW [Ruminococcaceae bacterium]|nr:putative lipid II flippase FtsW [Oscillospiraceae bacterium]
MAKSTTNNKNGLFQKGKLDITFLSLILILLTIGLVMLFSASYAYSLEYYGSSYKFIINQSIYAVIGIIFMFIASRINYHIWQKLSLPIFGAILILLFALLIMPPMMKGMTVKRWFAIGGFSFQPSEIAKFAVVIFFSTLIAANQKKMNSWKFVGGMFVLLIITCGLIVLEPHLSATLLVGAIGVVLIYIGGLNRKVVIAGLAFAVGAIVLVIITQSTGFISYGADRIKYWLDPWQDPTGDGFQTIQSLLAIGSGGVLGRGLGQSRQKYLWVPEPHNDFIFSIVCEELGLIGAVVIIIIFALLVWRGFKIAMSATDKFGSLLAIGLTFQVGLQALLNIWVVTNTIPNTGIGLPFFSYGGTALVILLAEMGIVLSVSRGASIEKVK